MEKIKIMSERKFLKTTEVNLIEGYVPEDKLSDLEKEKFISCLFHVKCELVKDSAPVSYSHYGLIDRDRTGSFWSITGQSSRERREQKPRALLKFSSSSETLHFYL